MNNTEIAKELHESYEKNMCKEGGFLPRVVPLTTLPDPFNIYVEAVDKIKYHYTRGSSGTRFWLNNEFRKFDQLLFSRIENLSNDQSDKLMSVLAILSHVYRWDKLPAYDHIHREEQLSIPDGINTPFRILTKKFNQPECGTLWNMNLCNWQLKTKSGGSLYLNQDLYIENMTSSHIWLEGTLSAQLEKWILVFVLIEARGAPAIQSIVKLVNCAIDKNHDSFIYHIDNVLSCIEKMINVFNQEISPTQIDHNLWREVIQPTFIWGLKDINSGCRLEGASGLQVGIIHCLDNALGIESNSEMAKAAMISREYMPIQHREFLGVLDKSKHIIRQYVQESSNIVVKEKYNKCLKLLSIFRSIHKGKGIKYIKGDGQDKMLTTTGLSIDKNSLPEASFRDLMQERLLETQASIIVK
jgi:hypothetical protein